MKLLILPSNRNLLASKEQAQGIDQINTAVAQMDKVTQGNAASAEESASASEELSAQARELTDIVGTLVAIVGGTDAGQAGDGAGRYPPEKINGIPPALLARYFERTEPEGRPHYPAGRALRGMIVFKGLNLSAPPFPMRGPLDCAFCRNVMIYFDNHVRRGLLLRPDGYLFVGHAESLTGQLCKLRNLKPAIYRACA